MLDYRAIFEAVVADPRYQANLDWGDAWDTADAYGLYVN